MPDAVAGLSEESVHPEIHSPEAERYPAPGSGRNADHLWKTDKYTCCRDLKLFPPDPENVENKYLLPVPDVEEEYCLFRRQG